MDQDNKDNLQPHEIALVNEIIGPYQKSLCRAIAQVAIDRSTFLGTNFPRPDDDLSSEKISKSHDRNNNDFNWHIVLNVGVIVFCEDLHQHEHFINLINMERGKIILQQKIEQGTTFQRRRRFITIFETQFGTVCLNFVDDDEADVFMKELYKYYPDNRCVSNASNIVKEKNLDDSDLSNHLRKHKDNNEETIICDNLNVESLRKSDKKQSLAGKFKQLFSIRGSLSNLSKKEVSKEYFKNKIGENQFAKLVVFLKVAGRNETEFDDPGQAREVLKFYEENKSSIDMIQPEREEEYGVIEDDMFETPCPDGDKTMPTEENNMTNKIIKRVLSYDETGIQWSYDDNIYVDPSLKPPLPPKFDSNVKPSTMVLPPKPAIKLLKREEKILSRQLSRPVRPAPPPPSQSSLPKSDSVAPDYANSREVLMRSIRERSNMNLKPVNEKTTQVPPNSPNPPKDNRRSLASVLNNALKRIHDVNIVYGEDPDSNEYWDER